MNILSLFDGMSCGQLALKRIGIIPDNYFASEIKTDGISVTMSNFPNTKQVGDVTKLDGKSLGKIDLLIGGSPCQDLSIAMYNRTGLAGIKSKLFYEYVRLLKETNPTYFLLENVGLMSEADKAVITEIMGVEPIAINSLLISAQLRNRLYWTNLKVEQPKDKGILLNQVLTSGWSDRDKARCLLESDSRPQSNRMKMFYRYFKTGFTTIVFESEQHYLACMENFTSNFNLKTVTAKDLDKYHGDVSVYQNIRFLNQTELERLQTVDEGYTKILTRDKAAGILGDGWTVDVIAHILKGIK